MDLNEKLEGLFGEIHDKQKQRGAQLMGLIQELKPLMNDIGDATIIVPLIAKYMDIAVKNDDMLVKLASLVYKAANATSTEESFGISEEEKQQLLSEFEKLDKENNG